VALPPQPRPLHGKTTLPAAVRGTPGSDALPNQNHQLPNSNCAAEAKVRLSVDQTMAMTQLFEGKQRLLSQTPPSSTPIFIANSMPVRDVEFSWALTTVLCDRFFLTGANGIDGTLSTALGMAHRNQSSVMLTGV